MLNFGLTELRVVLPTAGWREGEAMTHACGADDVLGAAKEYDDLRVATADLSAVYATTARPRDAVRTPHSPRAAAVLATERI